MNRAVLAGILALALCFAAVPATGAAPGNARVAILLLPSPATATKGKPFLKRIAELPGISTFGFVAASLGKYDAEQVLLDLNAGARVQKSLYDGDLPADPRLVDRHIADWGKIAARARTPPATILPGSLGQAVRDSGRITAYTGVSGDANREAVIAADRGGRIDRVSLGDAASVGPRAVAAWKGADLLVVKIPPATAGRRAIEAVLAARRAEDLVLVLQGPNSLSRKLLAAGAAGLGAGDDLRSASTRTDGLVITTDFSPTVLRRLGARVPGAIAGEPIEATGSRSVDDLVSLRKQIGRAHV